MDNNYDDLPKENKFAMTYMRKSAASSSDVVSDFFAKHFSSDGRRPAAFGLANTIADNFNLRSAVTQGNAKSQGAAIDVKENILNKPNYVITIKALNAAMPDLRFSEMNFNVSSTDNETCDACVTICGTFSKKLKGVNGFSDIEPTGKKVIVTRQWITITHREGKVETLTIRPDGFIFALYKALGTSMPDSKNTEDFEYKTYLTKPIFTEKHKSLMAKELTNKIFFKLKNKKTSKGYTLSNAIQTGVETPHLGVGITAGDEESWTIYKDIMYPIIKGWHGYDPEKSKHPTDLNFNKVKFPKATQELFDQYVVSTRIRAARNVSGYALPSGTDSLDRAGVEAVLVSAFEKFEGDLAGVYYSLGKLTEEETYDLRKNGFLFQKPSKRNLLTMAGAARSWPDNRGIFHNNNRTALCWVNEEDHCRIISMSTDGNVKSVFERFCRISAALKAAVEENGSKFMHSETLGFLGTCPSNLGTGMRASVMICLPKLNENVELLEKICASFDLQPRGSAGEHSAAVGAKWDISNKQRLGFSEVELVQKMIDGVTKLIAIEEQLANGKEITAGKDY